MTQRKAERIIQDLSVVITTLGNSEPDLTHAAFFLGCAYERGHAGLGLMEALRAMADGDMMKAQGICARAIATVTEEMSA